MELYLVAATWIVSGLLAVTLRPKDTRPALWLFLGLTLGPFVLIMLWTAHRRAGRVGG
jgi:hypothetical protein